MFCMHVHHATMAHLILWEVSSLMCSLSVCNVSCVESKRGVARGLFETFGVKKTIFC